MMIFTSFLSQVWAESPNMSTSTNRFVVDFIDNIDISEFKAQFQNDPMQSTELQYEFELVHPTTDDDALYYINIKNIDEQVQQSILDRFFTRFIGHPMVESAEYSVEYKMFEDDHPIVLSYPNDPLFSEQWNMTALEMPEIWAWQQSNNLPQKLSLSGKNITVAVIDTGLAIGNDLKKENIKEGISFVPSEPTTEDVNGHGTHVTGTIAQNTNNKIGVTGIAPDCTIIPYKVLGKFGGGQSEWVAAAIDAATKANVDVINLSLGGPKSSIIQNAIKKAIDKGIIIVAATGNSGREGVSSPAAYDGVIGVASVGPNLKRAPYSTYGAEVDIAAPGGVLNNPDPTKEESRGGILQQTISQSNSSTFQFRSLQGTSMASPHVAGAIALLLGAGAKKEDIPSLIYEHSKDLESSGHDQYTGHGLIQPKTALSKILKQQGVDIEAKNSNQQINSDTTVLWSYQHLIYAFILTALFSLFSGVSLTYVFISSAIMYAVSQQSYINLSHIYQNITNTLVLVGVILTIPYPSLRKIQANLLVNLGLLGILIGVEWENWIVFVATGCFLFFIQKNMGDYDGTTDYRNT